MQLSKVETDMPSGNQSKAVTREARFTLQPKIDLVWKRLL